MSKGLPALLSFTGLTLLCIVFVREQWTTPADELRVCLHLYHQVEELEQLHLHTFGTYAGLQELLESAPRRAKHDLSGRCQDGYCLQVLGGGKTYAILVVPDRTFSGNRTLSLYGDQTGIVRASFGLPRADQNSPALSPKELGRFSGDTQRISARQR